MLINPFRHWQAAISDNPKLLKPVETKKDAEKSDGNPPPGHATSQSGATTNKGRSMPPQGDSAKDETSQGHSVPPPGDDFEKESETILKIQALIERQEEKANRNSETLLAEMKRCQNDFRQGLEQVNDKVDEKHEQVGKAMDDLRQQFHGLTAEVEGMKKKRTRDEIETYGSLLNTSILR